MRVKNALSRLGKKRQPKVLERAGDAATREILAGSLLLGSRYRGRHGQRVPYTPEQLWTFRHYKGVGRPPAVNLERRKLEEVTPKGWEGRKVRRHLRRGVFTQYEAWNLQDALLVTCIIEAASKLGWTFNNKLDRYEAPKP